MRTDGLIRGIALAMLAGTVVMSGTQAQTALTTADVVAIERLSVEYNRTLVSCMAGEYAALFEQPDGFFESLNRGRVRGGAKLEALVDSERHCTTPNQKPAARPEPKPVIQSAGAVVTGRVAVGAAGHYEDVYVKTPAGWRFRSRNLLPPKAEAAQFTYRDFAEIHALAGDVGQFEDVQMDTPAGPRFRSAGLIIDPLGPGKATGRARLAGGEGYYRDVYVKTARGWRFESRTFESGTPSAAR